MKWIDETNRSIPIVALIYQQFTQNGERGIIGEELINVIK